MGWVKKLANLIPKVMTAYRGLNHQQPTFNLYSSLPLYDRLAKVPVTRFLVRKFEQHFGFLWESLLYLES